MIKSSKYTFCIKLFFFLSIIISEEKSIKTFHVYNSFGTQTKKLKNSITLKYDKNGFIKDSIIFTYSIPLNEKYVYVAGPNEGLKLERRYGREKVLSYHFENDSLGNRIQTTLLGQGDSIYWKEFIKYDDNGVKIKKIRYSPLEALNPINNKNFESIIWGETYNYDSSGTILEKKELYNNYVLEITRFKIDSLKNIHKLNEYFDPSVIFRTIYFHDEQNKLIEEITVGKYGNSIGSKTFNYDILGRKIKETTYNSDGLIDEIIKYIYDDNNFKKYEEYLDSSLEVFLKREILLNNQENPYIEALIDGKDRILEKNVYYYDINGRLEKVKQYDMVRQKQYNNMQIPVKVSIYEY